MASELKVDKFTGVTTAGAILVTGEGNSTTTSLQQGLAKAWVNFNGTGTIAIRDSLNISGLTDNGNGDYSVAINNDMANADYAVTMAVASYDGSGDTRFPVMLKATSSNDWGTYVAGSFRLICKQVANGGDGSDASLVIDTVHGDLA